MKKVGWNTFSMKKKRSILLLKIQSQYEKQYFYIRSFKVYDCQKPQNGFKPEYEPIFDLNHDQPWFKLIGTSIEHSCHIF